jgi:Domain of unknown function (DUF1906)
MSKLRKIAIGAMMLPFIVSYDFSHSLHNPVSEIGDAVAEASALVVRNVRGGSHLGFDTYAYPGDDAMRAWRDDSVPYEWVGFYLRAPCHQSDSWSGKRATLTDMGWGLAVIYVGQQVWTGTPRQKIVSTRYITKKVKVVKRSHGRRIASYVKKRVAIKLVSYARAEPGSNCSTHLVSAARGDEDAQDAVARTSAEGFSNGTVVFLDIERMDAVPQAMRDYYTAWTTSVLADGRYRPGYYTHSHNADLVYADVSRVFANAGVKFTPQFWVASGKGFAEDKQPYEVGHSFASVWQGVLDIVQTHNGVKLPIDVNVASVPSPSSHEYASAQSVDSP